MLGSPINERKTMSEMKENANFKYVIHFLKNGGERLRAIRLVIDVTGMGVIGAKDYVDGLQWKKSKQKEKQCTTKMAERQK